MADQEEKPKMSAEMIKSNADIAAQAALRAQQIMFRQKLNAVQLSENHSANSSPKKVPPQVPVRGDSTLKKPPEIPPKRHSLKKAPIDGPADDTSNKTPPPLPQKPSSAQNSPLIAPKFKDKPIGMRPVPPTPPTPQMQNKFDRPPANLPTNGGIPPPPPVTLASTNPFSNLQRNSPQLNQRSNSLTGSPQLLNRNIIGPAPTTTVSTTSSSSASSKNATPTPAKKQISPIESNFTESEDALFKIESGLRNMERAMQEQMNIRSMEAAAQKNDKRNQFNPVDFTSKRNIGGSHTSLDNGPTTQMSVIESMRLALGKNMRSMERGFSMDQMRLDQLHLNNSMRNFEANTNNTNRPMENHMKSLDRNLPLELQYSRHHHRSQSQQETLEQLRQNLINPAAAAAAGAMSRDDIRLRRRSSHDENQLAQAQTNNSGELIFQNATIFSFFPLDFFPTRSFKCA